MPYCCSYCRFGAVVLLLPLVMVDVMLVFLLIVLPLLKAVMLLSAAVGDSIDRHGDGGGGGAAAAGEYEHFSLPTVDGQNPALPIIRNIPKFP